MSFWLLWQVLGLVRYHHLFLSFTATTCTLLVSCICCDDMYYDRKVEYEKLIQSVPYYLRNLRRVKSHPCPAPQSHVHAS